MTELDGALAALRRQAQTPCSLAELAALADRLLAAAERPPARPTTERTIRFYVSRGVVRPPMGRGASARWEYPHLVDLLAARLAQQDGIALDEVARQRTAHPDLARERLVAGRLGVITDAASAPIAAATVPLGSDWRRFPAGPAAELHLASEHPLLQDPSRLAAVLSEMVRALAIPDLER